MKRAVALAPLACLLATGACVTDHDLFAAESGAGGTSAGGSKSGSGGVRYSTGGAPPDARAGSGGRAAPVEPSGPLEITFVNGVTDVPWLSLCFAKVEGGVEGSPGKAPFPAQSIAYGSSITVTAIPGVNFATDSVRPYVVAASPDAIAGLDCESILLIAKVPIVLPPEPKPADASVDGSSSDADASDGSRSDGSRSDGSRSDGSRSDAEASAEASPDTGAPPTEPPERPRVPIIRASALSVLPAGTFTTERHFLFVLAGCMGGPGVRDPSEQSVCGEGFSPSHPTLNPILAPMSRIVKDGRVSIQFLNASSAVRAADLRFQSKGLSPLSIAKNVVRGAIRPVPPNASSTSTQLGVSEEDKIQILADGNTQPIYDKPWSTTFAAGGIASVENGHAYTLLLIGPYPGFAKREWWNDPVVTVVEN